VKSETNYLSSLTALRGIAALWVMLFHIDVSIFYRNLGEIFPHASTGLITRGYLWVDFFFILSGFVINHVYGKRFVAGLKLGNMTAYFAARFRRIYPLHLFTLLILVVPAVAVPIFAPNIIDDSWRTYFSWSAMPSQLFLTNAMNQHVYLSWNIVSWSIGAEWWVYFVAVFMLVLAPRYGSRVAVFSILISFLFLVLLVLQHSGDTLDITYDYGFVRCLLGFSIGLNLHKLYGRNAGKAWLSKDIAFVFLGFGVMCVFHFGINDLMIVPLFALIILSAAYNTSAVERLFAGSLLQYLGKISYSIYMVHGLVFLFFWYGLPQAATYFEVIELSPFLRGAYVVGFTGLTLLFAHFTYRYIEVPGRTVFVRRAPQPKLAGTT